MWPWPQFKSKKEVPSSSSRFSDIISRPFCIQLDPGKEGERRGAGERAKGDSVGYLGVPWRFYEPKKKRAEGPRYQKEKKIRRESL